MTRKTLIVTGFGAGLLYLTGDIVGGIITPDYNYVSNAVSELIQSGAENRFILSSFLFLHALMIILFSIEFLRFHPIQKTRGTILGGILLLTVGVGHSLSSSIFPMDPVGAEATFPGTMHLVLVGITVLSIIVLMPLFGSGLHRNLRWKSFRSFTFICLAVIITAGISSPVVISKGIAVMGLTERMTAYTFYLWLSVLAFQLNERIRMT
ncbi:DUF998 domain-containing protein [Gemmatimonadota bacterium]